MKSYVDFYKILQVHYLAEPEIIESAYRKLAKKYHPDVSNDENTVEIMQKINSAYEVLGNSEKRRQYDLERGYNPEDIKSSHTQTIAAAKNVLDKYFINILNGRFTDSYDLISDTDKRNITRVDFINWQEAVSKIYNLADFSCKLYGVYQNRPLNNVTFGNVVEFEVKTTEYNTVMDMLERDHFTKITVLENGCWCVYVGYDALEPLISKFEALNGLLAAKDLIGELTERYSRADSLTGLLNQRGMLERLENEVHRYDRYGNIFSLIKCDIERVVRVSSRHGTLAGMEINQEMEDNAVKYVGELLSNSLRKLDVVARWHQNSFLVLLPETRWHSALKVVHKLRKIISSGNPVYGNVAYHAIVQFGAAEYASSVEESLDRANHPIEV